MVGYLHNWRVGRDKKVGAGGEFVYFEKNNLKTEWTSNSSRNSTNINNNDNNNYNINYYNNNEYH